MQIGKQLLNKKCKEVKKAQEGMKDTSMSYFKRFLAKKLKEHRQLPINEQMSAQELVDSVEAYDD